MNFCSRIMLRDMKTTRMVQSKTGIQPSTEYTSAGKNRSAVAYLNIFFLLLAVFFTQTSFGNTEYTPMGLQCEYLSDPLGVDTPYPRFSWKISSSHRGIVQESYRIIVSESLSGVKSMEGNLWDSGKIYSNETVNIKYKGTSLESNKKYYWRVGVWTSPDKLEWSEPATFQTGIMDQSEWKAQWITPQEEIVDESPLLRKEFQVGKKIKEAYAYVSSCGFYEFYLNGEKVGDHVLEPGITDYRKTIQYSTYDVSRLLKKGDNVAGAMLGNGAWNLRKTEGRWSWGKGGSSFGNPLLLMQLMITYEDGSRAVVVSDDTWKYTSGPIVFNNLYGGEDYDARKEVGGWAKKKFDETGWKSVEIFKDPVGKLKSQLLPPIRVTGTIQPVKSTNPSPGVYVFDLGQNIAGWWRLEMKGASGQTIRIRGAETVNDLLFPKSLENNDMISTKFPYQEQIWTDYTISGKKKEVYEPRFFYTGFRYIEVTTSDNENLRELNVEGRVVGSDLERSGHFESSNAILNKIHMAGIWSQRGNLISYPTDCPQREKGGYNGDGQVIAETSIHDFQMASFYTKWINDMRDAQEENGRIPNTSPTLLGGMGGGVAWGSAYILIPWWMSHYYQDTRILQEHYPSMKKYLQYLKNLATTDSNPDEKYIINDFSTYWFSLGEWCAPGQKDGPNHAVVSTFYYYYNSLLLSKIAGVLGHDADASYYEALSETVKKEFNKKFFNPQTSLYGTDETYQTYQLLALIGDVVPKGHREKVFNTIIEDIEERDNHLNTGIIGTKYLWPVLVEGGRADLAFKVATQTTYPSYGHWINNGSTTLLEEWSGENSHNHQMFGSVVEYFYKYLAGIQSPMEVNASKGYKNIYIEPHVPEDLNFVNASLETVAGMITSDWKKEESKFTHKVLIPANSTATVALPIFDFEDATVWEGGSKIWENGRHVPGVSGVREVKKLPGRIIVSLGSGEYNFQMEDKKYLH